MTADRQGARPWTVKVTQPDRHLPGGHLPALERRLLGPRAGVVDRPVVEAEEEVGGLEGEVLLVGAGAALDLGGDVLLALAGAEEPPGADVVLHRRDGHAAAVAPDLDLVAHHRVGLGRLLALERRRRRQVEALLAGRGRQGGLPGHPVGRDLLGPRSPMPAAASTPPPRMPATRTANTDPAA